MRKPMISPKVLHAVAFAAALAAPQPIYLPKPEALNGEWKQPFLQLVK